MKRRLCSSLYCAIFCLFLMIPASARTMPGSAGSGISLEQQKSRQLSGQITDSQTGEPVIGAGIQIKGRTDGEITDIDGNFTISVLDNDILTITSLGYVTQTVKVGTQTSLSILLVPDTELLDEVVVTAFGVGQKKESVVGSVQLVRPESLEVPSANLSSAFAGRLAGVVSYQRSGMPGQNGSDFYIRGISTISGVTSPLIILDGVEISAGDLNALDPEIIEAFSILKDATATAMYGTRGANGVMIIKTKSGKELEKPTIGVSVECNVTTPTQLPKFVDGFRYMELYNEAVTNQGTGDILYTQEQIDGTRQNLNPYVYPNVNWYDEIFKNYAFNQKANFNIRGGTSKINYFMNLTVNHETGMLKNRSKDFFSYNNGIDVFTYAFQNNIDFHMSKTSTISLHLNAQLNDVTAPAINSGQTDPTAQMNSIYSSIMDNNPVQFPAFFPAGEEKWVKWGAYSGGNDQGATNPLAQATRGYGSSFASTVIANLDFEQKFDFLTEGLRFKAMISFKNWSKTTTNRTQGLNRYYLDSYSVNPDGTYNLNILPIGTPSKPVLSTNRIMQGDHRIYFQTFVDYNRSFGPHTVSGLLLFNMDEYALNNGSDLISSLPRRKVGYAARLSYDYDRRYFVEFNVGYNGSENFAKGHRYGLFPSVAAGWNISQEKFWEPVKPIISGFKLRGSYGLVGNDQIGGERFIYMAEVNLRGTEAFVTGYGQGNTQSLSGPTYTRFQNDDITWEVGRKLNVGVDLELFGDLKLAVDAFREIRSNIFQQKLSIPNYLGTADSKIYGNLAKVLNYGVDVSAEYGKRIGNDLFIQFLGTFTFARNRVLEYDEAPGTRPALSKIGHSVNTIYGFVSDGLYIDQADIDANPTSTLGNIAIAPGDIKYVDQPDKDGNYDGKITNDDKIAMGYPTVPEIVYGFGPTVSYKDWDFSLFFQGAARTSLMMSGFHPFGAQYNRNVLSFIADDYWSATNQDRHAAYPRLTKYENNHNSASSDFWLRDGSFLKLKNAEIGYNFRKQKIRIYINGMNLLTFSKFKLWDPEMGGGAGLSYPTQRTFNIGLQVTFN
ncbi:MAG: TonB-dependent receptor [Bacteroidales bacterium]|nr:TonB-dependent receptor [Bacteroidales bacterium]